MTPSASVDTDGDGMPDDWNAGMTQADSTSDPILVSDIDDDGHGVADRSDAFPLDVSETIDTDADGTGNNADTDDDGDGVLDEDRCIPAGQFRRFTRTQMGMVVLMTAIAIARRWV